MNGPDHYREAERQLANLVAALPGLSQMPDGDRSLPGIAVGVATAQVHATLALAAAVAQTHLTTDSVSGMAGTNRLNKETWPGAIL